MRTGDDLTRTLTSMDGQGYGSYKQIAGTYDLGDARLAIDHVQTDPFAPPSKVRVVLDREIAGLPADLADRPGRIAVEDFLTRALADAARRLGPDAGGTGNSGTIQAGRPGQQILPRTTVRVTDAVVEARLEVGLPAAGRRVKGRAAARVLTDALPRIARAALLHENLDPAALAAHVRLYLDQEDVRSRLAGLGLVAFVGDGSLLPRRSGDSDLPLTDGVAFESPESLRVALDLPGGGRVTGMGVPTGVTVVVGGGYHGKSTLLRALERGVYPHVAGDGREWVVTDAAAVAVRAEDGRAVTQVDVSPFIGDLPSGADTRRFTTTNASGSTSQAANLVEAVEAGTSALLIDEDTSATNFMIRDHRMRRLVPADREPITPFVDRVRPLHAELGVSTVLVAGGSGAFFDVADHVLALDAYRTLDVTDRARELADPPGSPAGPVFDGRAARVPAQGALRKGGRGKPAKARGVHTVRYGDATIDLSALSQLVDPAQATGIGHALDRLDHEVDGRRSLPELLDDLTRFVAEEGLDALSPHRGHPGVYALPRRFELAAAVNRYRGLTIR